MHVKGLVATPDVQTILLDGQTIKDTSDKARIF